VQLLLLAVVFYSHSVPHRLGTTLPAALRQGMFKNFLKITIYLIIKLDMISATSHKTKSKVKCKRCDF